MPLTKQENNILITKGVINRLGDKIRNENGNITSSTIQELENFRTSHKDALAEIFKKLCQIKYKIGRDTIVTYRIKRFESIIRKLSRFPEMDFSRMWDIGGCRCIVRSNEDAYKLKDEIGKFLTIKKINDYISLPQNDGYKSLHLYVCLPGNEKTIEIQIRNQTDHNWATLVEISDLLYDSGLKEYGNNKDLLRFHKLLSDKEILTISDQKEIAEIIKKYDYIEKISKVFTRNHISVREQWLSIETNSRQKYFLIETSKSEVPIIEAFEDFNDAEKAYFSKFKTNQKANIVLTHLPKPNYNQISIAYSNYILTMHSFEDESSLIFESLILESLKTGKYFDFYKYFDYYQKIIINKTVNSIKELVHSKSIQQKDSYLRKKFTKKERDWQKDSISELKDYQNKITNFQRTFRTHLPQEVLKRKLIQIMIKYIFWKYKRELEKLAKKQFDY